MGNASADIDIVEILNAEEKLVDSLKDEYELTLNEYGDDYNCSEIINVMKFRYLYQKMEFSWMKTTELECALKVIKPSVKIFSPIDFEHLIMCVMYLSDGNVYESTKLSHDMGIDLIFTERFYFGGDDIGAGKTLIQCKLYRGCVPIGEIRDFFGVISANMATGIFFTTGELTSQAHSFIPMANGSPHSNKFHVVYSQSLSSLLRACNSMADLIYNHYNDDCEDSNDLTDEIIKFRRYAKNIIYCGNNFSPQGRLF